MASRRTTDWTLIYEDWQPDQQSLREALCTLGNGYFATRGAAEEASAGGCHYPGTYLAGGYDRLTTEKAGHLLENEDLVNWPNWLCLTFRPEGGDWFDLEAVERLDYRLELDLFRGVLERRVRFRDPGGRTSRLVSRRLVDMAEPHLAATAWELTPEDWSGQVEIRSALDGAVQNGNVARYRDLHNHHLQVLETGEVGEDGIYLVVRTNQSHIYMAQAARTRLRVGGKQAAAERHTEAKGNRVAQTLGIPCAQREQTLHIEKVVAIATSRDTAISEPALDARKLVARAGRFDELLARHVRAWHRLWHRADITLQNNDQEAQCILRLHIFHLLQTTSVHSIDPDVGVPSRGWHGEAYRGHILWDELFIFPFLNLRIPELTRSLLMYRYRRLPEAQHAARQAGYRGAMFPWQSGSDGREESQTLHLNPRSGRWVPDNSYLQRHVNSAIAYNFWQHYEATGDGEFLSFYGSEILLEVARFWGSMTTYNSDRGRYEIRGVMGPDEFHTGYPGSEKPGLNNNAYTNVMAVWTLARARAVLEILEEDRRAELIEDLQIEDEELTLWDEITRKMYVPFHDGDLISQFEGYADLEELDWDRYRKEYGNIMRLDRILDAEGDTPNRYKAGKQADVLMLFYLFSAEELADLFGRLGYPFDPEMIPRNIDYYLQRTAHGSTLSQLVHSWVLARSDRPQAGPLFKQALHSDIEDIQGGTTSEGIHLGAMAGAVDLVQRCYTGLEMREGVLWLNPKLPVDLSEIRLRVRYRGHWLALHLSGGTLTVSFEKGRAPAARVGFRGEVYEMMQGEQRVFPLKGPGDAGLR
jgi:trehalose/maltose hydrolase-like predicted phosphorylase